jgi:stage V sporulation protein B
MRRVQYIFANVFQNTILLAIMFCGVFMAFATDFGLLIYRSTEIARLLMALAPLVPLIYLDFIVDSMLNGLNQQFQTLKINILDSALRIVLIFFLVPKFGMTAYIVILYVSAFLNGTLSIRRLLIASDTKLPFGDWIIKPLLSIASSAVFVRLLFQFIVSGTSVTAWNLTLKIIIMIAVYIFLLFVTRCLDKDDVTWFKRIIKGMRK